MFKHARNAAEAFTMQQLLKQHCTEPDLIPLRLGSRQGEIQSRRSYNNSIANSTLYNMSSEDLIKLANRYGITVPVASLGSAQTYIDNQLFLYSDYVTSFNNTSPAERLRRQLEGVLQPFEPTLKAWIENLTNEQRSDIIHAYNTFPLGDDRMDVDNNGGGGGGGGGGRGGGGGNGGAGGGVGGGGNGRGGGGGNGGGNDGNGGNGGGNDGNGGGNRGGGVGGVGGVRGVGAGSRDDVVMIQNLTTSLNDERNKVLQLEDKQKKNGYQLQLLQREKSKMELIIEQNIEEIKNRKENRKNLINRIVILNEEKEKLYAEIEHDKTKENENNKKIEDLNASVIAANRELRRYEAYIEDMEKKSNKNENEAADLSASLKRLNEERTLFQQHIAEINHNVVYLNDEVNNLKTQNYNLREEIGGQQIREQNLTRDQQTLLNERNALERLGLVNEETKIQLQEHLDAAQRESERLRESTKVNERTIGVQERTIDLLRELANVQQEDTTTYEEGEIVSTRRRERIMKGTKEQKRRRQRIGEFSELERRRELIHEDELERRRELIHEDELNEPLDVRTGVKRKRPVEIVRRGTLESQKIIKQRGVIPDFYPAPERENIQAEIENEDEDEHDGLGFISTFMREF